ncbi:MAG: ABC transporter permease [Colwellia sp.]|nr:ABC transporter permease [Colwellia sp.]
MSSFTYQLKQAFLSLKKKPGFVFSVISTMGITLGALLCVLTLAYSMLIKPLPYPEPDRLHKVISQNFYETGELKYEAFNYPSLINLYKNQTIFNDSALIFYGKDVISSLPNQPSTTIGYVTPEWFNLLGSEFVLGRGFEKTEAINTHNPVTIISYQTWLNEFAKDPEILSQNITIQGKSFRIVGVLSEAFIEPLIYYPGYNTYLWLPWDFNEATFLNDRWEASHPSYAFVGKLKKDITPQQAEQNITPLVNNLWQENVAGMSEQKGVYLNMQLKSFSDVIVGDSQTRLWLLLAGVFSLVLIASSNMMNLFVSRTAEQQRELCIRAAVGAKKADLYKTILVETGLLMGFSAIIALVVASLGFIFFKQNLTQFLPRVEELSLNYFTLLSALLLSFLLSVLFAQISVRTVNYRALNSTLQTSGKGTGIQVSKRLRSRLITSQVAIAMILIFFSISLYKHTTDIIDAELGFNVDKLSHLSLSVSSSVPPTPEETTDILSDIKTRLLQHQAVMKVSQSGTLLRGWAGYGIWLEGTEQPFSVEGISIDENYFSMINQSFISGDNFTAADIDDENLLLVINDKFAQALAPDGSAIGKKLNFGNEDIYTVVGVVKGVTMPTDKKISMRIYYIDRGFPSYIIQLKNNQALSRSQAADLVKEVSSKYTVYEFYDDLSAAVDERLIIQKVTTLTAASLAVITMFLAALGLYGVLSYSTKMRRFEIGTRMAIGAKGKDIISWNIKENGSAVLKGMVISLVVMLLLVFGFSEQLNQYVSLQLLPLLLLSFALISVLSMLTCYLPLRRFINRPVIHALKGNE